MSVNVFIQDREINCFSRNIMKQMNLFSVTVRTSEICKLRSGPASAVSVPLGHGKHHGNITGPCSGGKQSEMEKGRLLWW